MFEHADARALTVTIDRARRSARVEVAPDGRSGPYVVAVAPDPGGYGWLVRDPSDVEPTWHQTFEAAIVEAITHAAMVLSDRVGRELGPPTSAVAVTVASGAADVC